MSLSLKTLVSYLQKKDRKEKPSENIYATINHGQVGPVNNMVSNCTKCVQPFSYLHANDCAIHQGMPQQTLPPPPCSIHHNGYNPYASYAYAPQQIPHSKSLEHYSENGAQFHVPHRHSFDQPSHYETVRNSSNIYETPYDCVDGRVHYSMMPPRQQQHAYHNQGNRHHLPFSNTITNQYFHPSSPPPPPPPPKIAQDSFYMECNGYPRNSNKEFTTCTQQKSNPPISAEQQFDEFSSSYRKPQKQQPPQQQQQQQPQNQNHNKTGAFRNRNFDSGSNGTFDDENYLHSLSLSEQQSLRSQLKKVNPKDNNRYFFNQPSLPTTSTSDSYEDVSNKRRTPRSRNDEGVGSYDSWNFVYQTLESNKHNGNKPQPTPPPPPPHQHHPVEANPQVEKVNTSRVANRVSVPTSKAKTWSCKFCTFLNEDKTRICAMCSKTKDLNPTESFNKPTCV